MELVAHRGANWHFPENTLPAFRRALQDGATVLEIDIRRTRDDVIVVCHDPIWHQKRISKTRYEALSDSLPRLEDILLAFPNIKLNINIKPKDLKAVYLTVDLLRKHQATSRVCLASFHLEVHRWLHDLKYEGERGLSRFEIVALLLLPKTVIKFFNWQGRRAQVPLQYFLDTSYFIKKCHALNISVDYWVVNQIEVAEKLINLGADRIMTDDPATLMSLSSP
ncbi:MAG: glycerophosphodiester phosphodiesterase family protein [Myxococcaceae bacterium]